MWWNTSHPYHSGPALASDSLLGILLYGADHESWQLEDVKKYVDWANANDNHDERQLYLEKPNEPESVNDYVQAPMIYAQYCCARMGRGKATACRLDVRRRRSPRRTSTHTVTSTTTVLSTTRSSCSG